MSYTKSMEVRDQIIKQSFVRFINHGYKATSLKKLEQITGLTKGAFYYYFKNKEEILCEGIEMYFQLIRENTVEEPEQVKSLKEFIRLDLKQKEKSVLLSKEWFGSIIIEVLFFQLVLEVEDVFPQFRENIYTLIKERLHRWEYVVCKAMQSGEIKNEPDGKVLARNLMSVSTSMLNIEWDKMDMDFLFSDMQAQFQQYYQMIAL